MQHPTELGSEPIARDIELATTVRRFPDATVLVIGDLILDRYVSGSVARLSPEAPIPVLRPTGGRATLGGAANVALNVATLAGQAILIGVVGPDPAGAEIEALVRATDRISPALLTVADRPTTAKTRFMSGAHQLLRLDEETTAPLPPGSGLTIAVAWPKGVVTPPGPARRALWWIEDNLGAMAAIIGTIIGIAYFIVAWNKVGRDPPRGTLVPLFSPPQGLSAPATRYIAEMDFDDRTFTSAILDLGVHRRLKLADDGRTLTLSRLEGGAAVDAPEEAMQAALFRRGVAVPLKQAQHAILAEAKSALNSGLQRAYAGTLFHWNGGWLAVGILVTAAAYGLTILALIAAMGSEAGVQAAVGLVFSSVAGVVIGIAIHQGRSGASLFSRIGIWLFMGLFALGFGGAGIGAFVTTIRSRLDLAALLLPFVLLPVLVSAFSWMRSPTAEGQKIRDAIEGFRHYLGIAEEHRLDILHPPEKTPELFERYLPYAVALDVENAWAAKFAGILASAGATAAVAQWYVTSANRDVGSLANRLGSSLSQTVASASTAPGSSSGSGGGGSSGGGGGGGGGSGW